MKNSDDGAGGSDWNSWANHVLLGMEELQKTVRRNCADTLEQKEKLVEHINGVSTALSKEIVDTREALTKDVTAARELSTREMLTIRNDVTTLKVRSGVWGLLGGMIPVALALLIWGLKTLS